MRRQFPDVNLIGSDNIGIPAHSEILSSKSSIFHAMFCQQEEMHTAGKGKAVQNHTEEDNEREDNAIEIGHKKVYNIKCKEFSCEELELMVTWIYDSEIVACDWVAETAETYSSLHRLARVYEIHSLSDALLSKAQDMDNLWKIEDAVARIRVLKGKPYTRHIYMALVKWMVKQGDALVEYVDSVMHDPTMLGRCIF